MAGLKASLSDKRAFSIFVPLSKIDPDQRMVYGYASTDTKDMEGETVSIAALQDALPGYMKFANLREMHQLSAIGVAKQADIDGKGLYIGGKIIDDAAWEKVKAGVYKGFSIGGTVTMRDPKDSNIITGLDLIEISAVDRPANPDCLIDVWKRASDEARRPVQKWDCGVLGHSHDQKADAVTCIESQGPKGNENTDLRTKLLKAVDSLDGDELRRAVAAMEKAAPEDDKAGDHSSEPAPPAPAPSSKADKPDEEKTPKVGDLIAFANDNYTDKGPSSGKIVEVDGEKVFVDHSDTKRDEFEWDKLGDPELKISDSGARIWLIKSAAEDIIGQPGSCMITLFGKAGEPPVKVTAGRWVEKGEKVKDESKEADKADDKSKDDKKDADGDKPTGDYGSHDEAGYADPGYQKDKKPRYPLKEDGKLNEKRIRAAWSYINKDKNEEPYSADQVKEIKDKIIAAWKEAIDKDGPPSAAKSARTQEDKKMDRSVLSKLGAPDSKGGFKKGLMAAASAIYCLDSMKNLHDQIAREAAVEGDDSSAPDRLMNVIEMFSECVQAILEEEIEEMLANKEIGDLAYSPYGPDCFYYAKGVVGLAKSAHGGKKLLEAFLKTVGDRTGSPNYTNLTKAFEALVQKGQDEWTGSKPADTTGDNDKWPGAPVDDQKAGDKWPAEVKEAAQTIHDKAIKMGATCTAAKAKDAKVECKACGAMNDTDATKCEKCGEPMKAEKAKKDDSTPAKDEEDGKKNPPPPKGDKEDEKDQGRDEGSEKGKGKAASGAAAIPAAVDVAAPSAELTAVRGEVGELKSMMGELIERFAASRNPRTPGAGVGRKPIGKSQDNGLGGEADPDLPDDPKQFTEEQRQSVLKAALSSPRFIPRG